VTIGRAETLALLAERGLAPSRALGQNFVTDPNTVRRIARLAGVGPSDHVIEIGGGAGALTRALIETGATVTTIERDRGLAELLRDTVTQLGATVIEADATEVDWATLLAGQPWVMVANLPYNVATPLVATVLDEAPTVTKLVVMVQHEVAERFAAKPKTKAYGAVTVKVNYWGSAKIVASVPPTVFHPQPRVASSVVEIRRSPEPAIGPDVSPGFLFDLVRRGFAQRRKMLRGALGDSVHPQDFAAADIAPTARAEELTVGDWGRLAIAVKRRTSPATP
jgi:16S rRNA (adenine1518-N6/adenine1519-N6)-dimethyltransferase